MLLDNLDKVSDLFLAVPLHKEADLKRGMELTVSLRIDTAVHKNDPHRFVKAWAFVVLEPATHRTEQLWRAFFCLEFDGLMVLLINTELQQGKGKGSTNV